MAKRFAVDDFVSRQAKSHGTLRFSHFTVRLTTVALGLLLLITASCSSAAPPAPPQPPSANATTARGHGLDLETIAVATATQGMVVGTEAPDAVRAGLKMLQQGGSAADAALTTALAQVPLMPGNFISYAGIMEFLYYDAQSGEIYSLNAGWDVPRAETDPLSIPHTPFPFHGNEKPSGRTALVPGFMAGVQSVHGRFGIRPFAELFEPAIAFARQGVTLDAMQAGFIAEFESVIARLPDTAALFTGEDGRLYQAGDQFRQPEMAKTLAEVARNGAAAMYTGAWGRKFVEVIQDQGGLMTMEDTASYRPLWTEPVHTSYGGYEIYGPGLPGFGGVSLVEAFNLLEVARLEERGHFLRDPETLFWMMQISRASLLNSLDSQQQAVLFPGQDLSLESRMTKAGAARLWQSIQAGQLPFFMPLRGLQNSHSAAVVAVDNRGNVAAMTHTSNSYLYGGSGIAVDGVYIPDPGSYQQSLIQRAGAGHRLPNPINPVIVLQDGQPVWASSCIGNVHNETLQRLASWLTFGLDFSTAQRAPSLLAARFETASNTPVGQFFRVQFEQGLLQKVQELGQPVEEIAVDFDTFALNRGVLATVNLDRKRGTLSGAVPAVLGGFAAGY